MLGGDELSMTQEGNNNAYCQDNEISWFDWQSVDRDLLEFTRRVVQVMRSHPVFQRRRWFKGRSLRGDGVSDIAWFRFDGQEMSDQDWEAGFAKSFAVFLNGDALRDCDDDGHRLRDDSFLLIFNAHHEPLPFTTPPASFGAEWRIVVDTTSPLGENDAVPRAAESLDVAARSMLVLSRPSQETSV